MPLVPAPIYTAWFSRKSWVYRNYAFLFTNPLWQKRVPNGASLCPMFWSALFALFVLRPLVYLTLGLRGLARGLGLVKLLKTTDALFGALFGDLHALGLTTAMGLCVTSLAGMLLFVGGSLAFEGLAEAAAAGYLSPFIALLASFFTAFTCGVYASAHKNDTNRCRVEIYTHVVLGLSLLTVAVLHPGLLGTVLITWPVAVALWLGGALLTLLGWIVSGFLGLFISALSGSPLVLWALAAATGLSLYGWFNSRFDPFALDGAPKAPKLTRAEVRENLHSIADHLWSALDDQIDKLNVKWDAFKAVVLTCPVCTELARSTIYISRDAALATKDAVLADIEARQKRLAERSEACRRATAAVSKAVAPVVAVLKQIRILCSYLWAFVKAIKGKQCPYVRFQD